MAHIRNYRFLGALGGGGNSAGIPPPPEDWPELPPSKFGTDGAGLVAFALPGIEMEKVWPSLRV